MAPRVLCSLVWVLGGRLGPLRQPQSPHVLGAEVGASPALAACGGPTPHNLDAAPPPYDGRLRGPRRRELPPVKAGQIGSMLPRQTPSRYSTSVLPE